MTTLDLTVNSDAHEDSTGNNFSDSAAVVTCTAHTAIGTPNRVYFGGFEFVLTAEIPNGATIDAAYITVQANALAADDPNVDISAEDSADAPDFVTNADVTSRTRTAASAQWTATGIGTSPVNSPSIVSVLQELVDDNGGLVNGAGIVIFMDGRSDALSTFAVVSLEGTGAPAALHIEFTAGGAGTDNLTANDLATGVPLLDSPAIGQVHGLTASDLASGTPTLSSATLGQVHALTPDDLTAGQPVLSSPALGQAHPLTADDLTTGQPVLDSPALGQIHVLVADYINSGTPLLDTAVLGQIHSLTATDLLTGIPTLSSPHSSSVSFIVDTFGTVASAGRIGTVARDAPIGTISRAAQTGTVISE
jgi:hypothetical protein